MAFIWGRPLNSLRGCTLPCAQNLLWNLVQLVRTAHMALYWVLFCLQQGDPDTIVEDWLSSQTPLGITKPIPCNGVFPVLSSEDAARAARNYAPADHAGGSADNYTSYREFTEEADAELRREQLLGYMVRADTEVPLRVSGKPLAPSNIVVIIKDKPDGSKKVRLVHDLSRPGVNHRARLP